ncbi:Strongly-conserved Zn-finger binding protein (TFIIIA) [Lambiella insularis]|nr:Strongly-conserved Zn-finger binding protein (TFIIIA) [Lambiella insularis]
MASSTTKSLPLRVRKRKLDAAGVPISRKRTRLVISEGEHSSGSEISGEDVDGSSSDTELVSTSASTPLSPIGSKDSPHWPSELKTKHCTYPDCTKSFNRQARLNEHMRSHTNTRPFVCPHKPCTKDFLRDTHLKHHIKSAHSNVRDYVCKYEGCEKSFATGTRLKRHHAAHEGREKYKCKVNGCGQIFRKHGTLQAHMASVHEGKNPYICDEVDGDGAGCRVGFDSASKLKTHKGRVHSGNRYSCVICNEARDGTVSEQVSPFEGVVFPTYAALTAHTKEAHPPTCTHCGLQCATAHALKSHVDVQHGSQELSERQTHLCTQAGCGRGFTKRGNLLVHIKTVHANERSFVCGVTELSTLNKVDGWDGNDACGKDFALKVSLEEHIRTAHLGLDHSRKGKSNMNKAPKRKVGLKNASTVGHLTGTAQDEREERNIPCLLSNCNFYFGREYDLEMHLQSKHGLADSEIQHLRAEREGHGAGLYGYGLAIERDNAYMEAERVFDERFMIRAQVEAMDDAREESAARGGQFWVGRDTDIDIVGDEWEVDEREMRLLIEDDNDDDGNKMTIDPVLLR